MLSGVVCGLVVTVGLSACGNSGKDSSATTATIDAAAQAKAARQKAAAERAAKAKAQAAAKAKARAEARAKAREKAAESASMNKRTRAVVEQLRGCEAAVAIVVTEIGKSSDIALSGDVSTAKDICKSVRVRMVGMDTENFGDQTEDAEIAVDQYASGLGAISAYIDSLEPSKVVDARDHFTDARTYSAQALRGINERRAVYNLKPIT